METMERKIHWRILEKRRETAEAATLVLAAEDGQTVRYHPGQYLSFIRQIQGKEERRAYSFSSCPGYDGRPAITVKRIPNGAFSNWLLHTCEPGDRLLSGRPASRFLRPATAPAQLVFVAAGSGITPIFSQLKWLLELNNFPETAVTLYFANRDSANTIFKKTVHRWIASFPNRFACTYLFSREKGAAHALYRHLSNNLFEKLLLERLGEHPGAKQRANTHFYLCAPEALMRIAQMTLRVLDYPEANIHRENFVPDTRIKPREIDTARKHSIVAAGPDGGRIEFDIFHGETILNGALRQGIALPYTCKTGVCFTCLARCTKGKVEVQFSDHTKKEGPGALVNTCIGYPVSDSVEIHYES